MKALIFVVSMALIWSVDAVAQTNSSPATSAPPKGTPDYLDWRNGFLDVHFGIHLADFQGAKYENTQGQYKIYSRDETNDVLGTVHIHRLRYAFLNDRLTDIKFYVERKDCGTLLEAFRTAYGESFGDMFISGWAGRYVKASIVHSDDGERCDVDIFSQKLLNEILDEENAQDKAHGGVTAGKL